MMYYVIAFAVGDIHSNVFIGFSLSGLVEFPSSIAAYFCIEKWNETGVVLNKWMKYCSPFLG